MQNNFTTLKKIPDKLTVASSTCKEFGSCHPILTIGKKPNSLKNKKKNSLSVKEVGA